MKTIREKSAEYEKAGLIKVETESQRNMIEFAIILSEIIVLPVTGVKKIVQKIRARETQQNER